MRAGLTISTAAHAGLLLWGLVFLQNTEVKVEELVPKLQAIAAARGGADERIYVRGDRTVDYGTMMKIMGRLNAAGFRRVALVTEVEQGS